MSFSVNSVFSQTTTSGFKQNVCILFYGTPEEARARAIALDRKLQIPVQPTGVCGFGIYLYRSADEALQNGNTCVFKVLVYPGWSVQLTPANPGNRPWQATYDSAWSSSGIRCVRQSSHVRVLGLSLAPTSVRHLGPESFVSSSNRSTRLRLHEIPTLKQFLYDHGLIYTKWFNAHLNSYIVDDSKSTFVQLYSCSKLERSDNSHASELHLSPSCAPPSPTFEFYDSVSRFNNHDPLFYWTRSWAGCLENKLTGRIVKFTPPDGPATLINCSNLALMPRRTIERTSLRDSRVVISALGSVSLARTHRPFSLSACSAPTCHFIMRELNADLPLYTSIGELHNGDPSMYFGFHERDVTFLETLDTIVSAGVTRLPPINL